MVFPRFRFPTPLYVSALAALTVAVTGLSACTVVTMDDDRRARELRSDRFDAAQYVREIWPTKVQPEFSAAAPAFSDVLPAIDANLPAAGHRYGRQAEDGSPWTFIAQGDGVVTAIDRGSRAGTITLMVATSAGAKAVTVQVGPVIYGSAIRDSQPYIAFNDFTNQIAFANVSNEMNRAAMVGTSGQLARLQVGDKVHIAGAFSLDEAGAPVRMIPVVVRSAS
jgi:predicted lipoprotein